VLVDVKARFEELGLEWVKYIVEEIEKRLENITAVIEEKVWGITSAITMSVYTKSDLMLKRAETFETVYKYYENKVEWFKNVDKKDEEVMEEVEWDDSII
jgi:hypothetical protein